MLLESVQPETLVFQYQSYEEGCYGRPSRDREECVEVGKTQQTDSDNKEQHIVENDSDSRQMA